MIDIINEENSLNLTQEERDIEYNSQIVESLPSFFYKFYTFNDKYNWKKIENKTWNDNALYYILNYWWKVYLQTHIPEIEWYEAVTELNKLDIVNNHVTELNNSYINFTKYNKTLNYFKAINWDVEAKERYIEQVEQDFLFEVNKFSAWYSQVEIDSWKTKEEEAKIVEAGGTSEFLTALCVSWETEQDLSIKIITNATAFRIAYAQAEQIKREKLNTLII